MSYQVSSHPLCLWLAMTELGEGPVWCARQRTLWFVDIRGRALHSYTPNTGGKGTFRMPDQPGFVVPRRGSGFIVGLRKGLYHFDDERETLNLITAIEPDLPGNRLNDASTDSTGRVWFGSMDDNETDSSGALYSWSGGALRRLEERIIVTNGPATSPDGRTLYHTDTIKKEIYAYDLAADGGLGNKRTLISIEEGTGYPDGTAVDAEGCLWIALFGGWGVRRYSPCGELLEFMPFPCANVTKVAFGGDDRRTVFATTACKTLSESERARQPLAGALFGFRTEVPGLPSYEVECG